jgi:hypothetical protein
MMDTKDPNSHRPITMTQVLSLLWSRDGVAGLFKGCDAQLFNTVLKSALLLMTKEQLDQWTTRLLCRIHGKTV